ncbi:hypothetical protein JCM19053_1330 [Vibrio sp. JCM 19053]|nr:hypothetical protein JCM19053_1330 [Vibrio sp. JCM 19053]
MVGEAIFKAADKRETIENKELEQDHVIWIDTPGLMPMCINKMTKLPLKVRLKWLTTCF